MSISATPPHTAKAVLFSCIDDRLTTSHAEFISNHGNAFHASLAGGGAAFLELDERTVAVKQIVATFMINHVTRVYLESHTDCGAYRLAGVEFSSDEAEVNRLYDDLDQAATYVRDALKTAGATDDEIMIETRIVDPSGHFIPAAP